jgi:imidazolonepropionase-like amidohydrolase
MTCRLIVSAVVLIGVQQAFAEDIVIKAAKVCTQAGAPLTPGAVHVKDGKIVAVGPSVPVPSGAKVIDLGTGVLLPGLIDAFSSSGLEGGTAESTAEVTPSLRVIDAVDWTARSFRQLRSEGVTTVGIVPGSDNVIGGLSCVVKTAGERSKRIVKADHALVLTLASDPASGNNARNRPDTLYNRQPTNRMGIVWMLRSELSRARSSSAKEHAVLREALSEKRPVICVSRSDSDLAAALRLRQEFPLPMTLAGGQEAHKTRAELAAAKVPILLGPLSTTGGAGTEGTETILNLAGTLHEAGVPFALTGGDLLDQARLAARFGLPKEAALAAITSSPARLLGLDRRIGTIAPGLDADLVALSGDPFDLSSKVRWTMIDGVIRAEEP